MPSACVQRASNLEPAPSVHKRGRLFIHDNRNNNIKELAKKLVGSLDTAMEVFTTFQIKLCGMSLRRLSFLAAMQKPTCSLGRLKVRNTLTMPTMRRCHYDYENTNEDGEAIVRFIVH